MWRTEINVKFYLFVETGSFSDLRLINNIPTPSKPQGSIYLSQAPQHWKWVSDSVA